MEALLTVDVEDLESGALGRHTFDRAPILVGRGEGMHLRLAHPSVAPAQGIFYASGGEITFMDLAGGASLDDRPLAVSTALPIPRGATISIGRVRMRVTGGVDHRDAATVLGHAATTPQKTMPWNAPEPALAATDRDAIPIPRSGDSGKPIAHGAPPPETPATARELADAAAGPGVGIGTRLGQYEIVGLLGRGGMGMVHRARHVGLKREFALKTLSSMLARSPEAAARFLREAEAASRIRHPHVVDVTDFGTDRGTSYLVMELLEGEDLGQALERGPISPDRTADVMLAVAAAVQAAHAAGVIHRDLKSRNVFLARTALGEMVPKVLDFGVSRLLDGGALQLTQTGDVIGTTHYLAPELIDTPPVPANAASDQYALGVLLYQCVTGRKPFTGESAQDVLRAVLEARPVPARTLTPSLPEAFAAVIARAMARDPAARFPSVHALGRALLPLASGKRRVMWEEHFAETVSGTVPLPRVVMSELAPPELRRRVGPSDPTRTSMPVKPPAMPIVPTPAPAVPQAARAMKGALATLAIVGMALAIFALTREGQPAAEVKPPPSPVATTVVAPVAEVVVAEAPAPPTIAPAAEPPEPERPTSERRSSRKHRRGKVKYGTQGVPILP